MRIAALTLSCLVSAFLVAPAAAENSHGAVAGLYYRIAGSTYAGLAQAVRVRADTGKVLVRYPNAKTEWVEPERLIAQPQPLATDAGPYLFVVAALACLLDENKCVRHAASHAAPAITPRATGTPAFGGGKLTPASATSPVGAAH